MVYENILQEIESRQELLCALNDYIWDHPEIAFQEKKASNRIIEILEAEGFAVERGLAGLPTAFSASFGEGHPVVAVLGEYDALDGLSQKADCFHREKEPDTELGHGCGHQALGTGALGAVLGIKRFLEDCKIQGTVVYYGCPAEEGGSGKSFMVRDGVFDDVDCAFTWHPCDSTDLFSGRTLAVIGVTYHFTGVSAHAAGLAHIGRSALDAVELMNVGANYLREHVPQETRIHYAITDAGGRSPNVVPAKASVFYYLRSPEPDTLLEIYERVNKIAEGAALMTGTQVEVEYHKGMNSLLPNTVLDNIMYDNLKSVPYMEYTEEDIHYAGKMKDTIQNQQTTFEELLAVLDHEDKQKILPGREDVIYRFIKPRPSIEPLMYGSTDVGDVSLVCPVSQIHAATWAAGTQMHTWQAVAQGKSSILHKGMLYAAKVMACSAADVFTAPELIEQAKKEMKERTAGQKAVTLMFADAKPQLTRR